MGQGSVKYICKDLPILSSTGNIIEDAVNKYDSIVNYYNILITSAKGKQMIDAFDRQYGNVNITQLKKIDLMLWQTRQPSKARKIMLIQPQ